MTYPPAWPWMASLDRENLEYLHVDLREIAAEPASVYVAVWRNRPIGASAHLGDTQAAALARESKYDPEPREYRWDAHLGGGYWDLMVFNASTQRWNRTTTFVSGAPIVDAPGSPDIY